MVLNGLFNALWFNANVPLGRCSAAVLQQSLNQDDVVTVGLVDLGSVPLAETVGADAVIAQVVADNVQLRLNHPLCNGKDGLCPSDAIAQAVVLDVLVENQWHCEDSALAGFLLHDLQPVTVAIPDDIAQSEFQDVADPKPQIALQNQGRGDAIIGSAAGKAFPHGLDDLLVLRCGQCFCFLVHSLLP